LNSKQRWLRLLLCILATLSCVASGAGLGKLTVQSGLGQPFRGEIDLIAVPAEEVGSVAARTASAETYREANIEYVPSVANIKFAVEKRSNGQPYIKVFSAQPLEEPFVELLVEVAWPSGKLLREYPILLDPPGFGGARNLPDTGVAPLPPSPRSASVANSADAPAASAVPLPAPSEAAVKAPVDNTAKAGPLAKPAEPTAASAKPAKPVAGASTAATDAYGPVKPGETLRSIADRTRPHDVALEQMMVAIYRENVGAFIGKNINQLKIGERLKLPAEDALGKVSIAEARTLIRVQTARWIAYHQKLAAAAAKAAPKAATTQQSAAGQVTPKTQDKTPAPADGTDVLTISKGEPPGARAGAKDKTKSAKANPKLLRERISALEEEAIAREGALKEANSRVAQLERQVQEMRELLNMKRGELAQPGTEPGAGSVKKPAEPAAAKPADQVTTAPMPPKPGDMTPPPVIAPPKPALKPAAQDVGMVEKIMEKMGEVVSSLLGNPLLLGGIGAAVLGVLGLLYVRRKRAQQLGAFTATNVGGAAASAAAVAEDVAAASMSTEKKGGLVETGESAFLSEFNKVAPGAAESDDVDPVAEADVYLAYGRDAQAEEILKEAMPKDPQRVEIPLKLLEIYAGRKSVEAFESVANTVHAAIGEEHPAWARVCELGRGIDPGNALYASAAGRAEPSLGTDSALGRTNVISFPERKGGAEPGALEPELKEGLDFDLGFGDAAPAAPAASALVEANKPPGEVDFDFSELGAPVPSKPDLSLEQSPRADKFDLEFDVGAKEPAKVELPLAAASANDSLATDFDIDFDLDSPAAPGGAATATRAEQTKRLSDLDLDLPAPAPGLDLKGISLDLDAPASGRAAASGESAIGDAPAWRTAATKLDLARAYLELGDKEGAKEIIDEVIKEGTPAQQQEAHKLAARL
jgi:pilus assembly protein FimV